MDLWLALSESPHMRYNPITTLSELDNLYLSAVGADNLKVIVEP